MADIPTEAEARADYYTARVKAAASRLHDLADRFERTALAVRDRDRGVMSQVYACGVHTVQAEQAVKELMDGLANAHASSIISAAAAADLAYERSNDG